MMYSSHTKWENERCQEETLYITVHLNQPPGLATLCLVHDTFLVDQLPNVVSVAPRLYVACEKLEGIIDFEGGHATT